MMLSKTRIILTALSTAVLIASVSTSAMAEEKNGLVQECQKLFSETEKLVQDAEKQPGTHTQVNKIKSKLNQSKQQILAMEAATQAKSCEQGLAKLTRLKSQDETQ